MNNDKLMFTQQLLRGKESKHIRSIGDNIACCNFDIDGEIIIGTHNGIFHADDALAVALLVMESQCQNYQVVRSRVPADFVDCDFVVDVSEGLLDHHGSRAEAGVAACTRVLQLILQSEQQYNNRTWVDFLREVISPMVEKVAAQDTGSSVVDHPFPWVHPLAAADGIRQRRGEKVDSFRDVVERILQELKARWIAFDIAAEARQAAEEHLTDHPYDPVVVFPDSCREAEVKKLLWCSQHPAVFYVSKEADNDYRVLCAAPVDQEFSFFGSKMLLPERFRSLRGEELSAACGIPGGIFCHAAGFIAGFDTEAGATDFAKLCLE